MNTLTHFRPYTPEQTILLPPDLCEWLPEDHLVYFILDVVGQLDLSSIYSDYSGEKGGQPPFHPEMMVALLLYAYCVGLPSSRKIQKATYEAIPFRVLTNDQHPDHATICAFRKRHLGALAALFLQVLRLCQQAGLVKLGHVALDGTKMHASASKHKAMSYERMARTESELEEEIKRLMNEAESTDAREDALFGKDGAPQDLPKEVRFKQGRLEKIRQAKRVLEDQARAKAEDERIKAEAERAEKIRHADEEARTEVPAEASDDKPKSKCKPGPKPGAKQPKEPSQTPAPKAQHNFTDPDSRIMPDGATKSFEQSFNCQAAVDGQTQIIVASGVTQETNDKRQLAPMAAKVKANLEGCKPQHFSADSGYFSEENIHCMQDAPQNPDDALDLYIATGRVKHGQAPPPTPPGEPPPAGASAKERMAHKLRTPEGRAVYAKRKEIVEPVFGQIKEARGFRRFSLRGLTNVTREWDLICLTHNLLKLFRNAWSPARV